MSYNVIHSRLGLIGIFDSLDGSLVLRILVFDGQILDGGEILHKPDILSSRISTHLNKSEILPVIDIKFLFYFI